MISLTWLSILKNNNNNKVVLKERHVELGQGHGPRIRMNDFRSLAIAQFMSFIHYYPPRVLAYRAAVKLPHPCLSLADLWFVPQVWFVFFISASTVLHQVVFGRPRFHFPSGVQWIATLVMELASLCSTCPVQRHRFLVMMVIKEKYVDPNKLKSLPTNSFF